ncbi:MAG: nucleotidyltransferase domain-containing protein [Planctomycetota bacterium]|nr:nucleotidyltransferase domain-containing protein [Planctomycetota bacterium]
MERAELLKRIKATLQEAFGPRLRGVILYGSEARGTAEPDSDIDLLVLLEGPVTWDDSKKSIHVLYPLVLEIGRPIHAVEVDEAEYEAQEWPLYRMVKAEGVSA